MDINLLVINVGNSRLAAGVFQAGDLTTVHRADIADSAAIESNLRTLWSQITGKENAAVAAASVNPAAAEQIEQIAARVTGQKVEWIGKDIDLPMRVLTDPPAETGVDRIVTLAAAFEQMQKACVVVDAGTAITVNCCNDKGEFLGGAIAPGVAMQFQALHTQTAKLPQVDFALPQGVFGRSTKEAIRHGVYHGIRGMVKELVENFATELGNWPEIIATGGDASALFENWELIHAISPDLTLYGIALAYANHHIKHNT